MYPKVKDPKMVGEYPTLAKSGGGYVWDEVLEYRVWCHPEDEDDYYYAFDSCEEAFECSHDISFAENPLALVLQREYIDEPEPGKYIHVKKERITEWPVTFLSRPRRTDETLPIFFSAEPASDRLNVIRGLA